MTRLQQLSRRARSMASLLGLGTAVLGGVALTGRFLGRASLHTWLPGSGSLGADAALGFLLIGVGIALVVPDWRRPWLRWLALPPALGALVLGGLALSQVAAGVDLGLDEVLATQWGFDPGSMPAVTALGLLFGGLALSLQAIGLRRGLPYAQALSLLILGVGGVALTGHLYDLETLAVSLFTAVSLAGAAGLVTTALGLLFARPEVGIMTLVVDPTAGGASVRRLLPLTGLVVFLLGAVRTWGEERGYFPGAEGTAMFAVTTGFLLAGLIIWNALRLRDAELSLRREQEIRSERQRQFRHAIVDAPIPILMFAEDGEILQVSRTVEELTGYQPGELTDLKAWGRLVAGEEGGRGAVRVLLESLGDPRETVIRTRDGQRRIWRLRTSSLGILGDDRGAYVAMATDITEIRAAEERKDEFLAILGHELRNPLAALSSGLALQRFETAPRRREELGEMMERQVRHLARLLDDLLDVSRISRGKIELQPEVVALDGAVRRVVEEHRDLLEDHEPRISLTVPPRPVPVSADPIRLHQILGNLVGNAIKYTPDDGRIWITLERDEDQAILRVRDSGVGMDPESVSRIFEPFRQLDQSGRGRGGLGLGLTLVRQLATMHGGTVAATSRGPGRGSTFVLRLPLAADDLLPEPVSKMDREAAEAVRRPASPGPPLRVLVVDDHREVATGFAEILSLAGHEVVTAYDGESALAEERRFSPQVVFLDLDLPDLDGRTVARRIRERHVDPPLLVAVSGFGGERHLLRSAESGLDHHLVKPVDMDQVLGLLASVEAERAEGVRA